jgi:RimJ/RimL family protein N-acetyltransferase
LDEVRDFISRNVSAEMNIPDTWVQFVIIERQTQQLVGDIGIHFLPSDLFQVEIGCTLDVGHQGKGFATEALQQTINFLFGELNKHRITASIDPRNTASVALMDRLGFRQEAHFRQSLLIENEWVDDLVYALLREEWQAKNGRFFQAQT